jgi:L-rhamnose mutarotase
VPEVIRFRAVSRDGIRDYEMPYSEQPVAKFRHLPADMLNGAVLYLDEDEIDRRWQGAQQAVMLPEVKPKKGKR